MIRYYSNRDLARRLGVNLARWKRWSREFLPPDPLGGLQSGYARQYHPDEGFRLFLAGTLVGEQKLTIPEARRALSDLEAWMAHAGMGFRPYAGPEDRPGEGSPSGVADAEVLILPVPGGAFSYRIRWYMSRRTEPLAPEGHCLVRERCLESWLPEGAEAPRPFPGGGRLLPMSSLLRRFADAMDLPPLHYPMLDGRPSWPEKSGPCESEAFSIREPAIRCIDERR
jgi:hypothetical protein